MNNQPNEPKERKGVGAGLARFVYQYSRHYWSLFNLNIWLRRKGWTYGDPDSRIQ